MADVNDNPPRVRGPPVLHVQEGAPQGTLVGVVTCDDPDLWQLGHGPPFHIQLDHDRTAHLQHLLLTAYRPGE